MPYKDKEKQKVWRKKYREDNKESIRQKEKEYYHAVHKHKSFVKENQAKNRRTDSSRFSRAKIKASTKNVEWSLTLDEFVAEIRKPCIYCNNELGKPSEVGIGLDQIIPGRGYVIGNVFSCCYTCNRIKGDDLSVEETKVAVEAILLLRKENNGS